MTLRTPTQSSVPFADAGELGRETRRTTASRVLLAAVLAALGVTAFLLARDLGRSHGAAPAPRSGGVVVLDLSSSVGPWTYRQIRRTLARLTASREALGVVIFSDTAYEVVPPGASPVELAPIASFFKPHAVPSTPIPFPPRLIENPRFYDNPWSSSYHGGTQISRGLGLAQRILEREKIKQGRVILVSDLSESSLDQDQLTRTLLGFAQQRTKLEVVDLSPGSSDRRLYSQLTGGSVKLTLPPPARASVSRLSPYWLVAAALALVLILAGNEYWCRRLWWRSSEVAPT